MEVGFVVDRAGLIFDLVGLEQVGLFKESLKTDGHGWLLVLTLPVARVMVVAWFDDESIENAVNDIVLMEQLN